MCMGNILFAVFCFSISKGYLEMDYLLSMGEGFFLWEVLRVRLGRLIATFFLNSFAGRY
jgi:hypothetical protein